MEPDLFNQPPQGNFYNTTRLRGAALKAAEIKAGTQTDEVLKLYKRYEALSPSQCLDRLALEMTDAPLFTSVRRAISDLAVRGWLEKTSTMVEGKYGRDEHVYRLAKR
jgi:hypothetical protein